MEINIEEIKEKAIEAIKTVYDPELPVNLWDLGLIYSVDIDDKGIAYIKMTLTSPACPVAETLPMQVQEKVASVEGVKDVELQVVFNPPWTKDKMSEEARFALDMY